MSLEAVAEVVIYLGVASAVFAAYVVALEVADGVTVEYESSDGYLEVKHD